MDEEILNKYRKAEKISNDVLEFSKPLVKERTKAIDVAEIIEKKIKEFGGGLAFPVNISINENAAHYTPDINDPLVFSSEQIVKVDFGVQIDGYIWDRAFSVCIGKKSHPLIEASEKALAEAFKLLKPKTKVFEISQVVEDTLAEFGFNPIRNLSGHGLDQYVQHSHPSIPNGKNNIQDELESGHAVAMEVFATDGAGMVKESSEVLIYRFLQDKPVRLYEARKILEAGKKDFQGLPFAKRWLTYIATGAKLEIALRQLLEVDALEGYSVLREERNGLVAQTENTKILE